MSMATKVAVQMNCKLGGIVIGYDTYHDTAQKGSTVGDVVCSTKSTFTSQEREEQKV